MGIFVLVKQPNVFRKQEGFVAGPRGQRGQYMVWLFCNCRIAKKETRREVEKSFLMVDGHTIDRVGRQHIDLGCTPGGWLKKGTVDVQLWSGGGNAWMHHMVHPSSESGVLGVAHKKSDLYVPGMCTTCN